MNLKRLHIDKSWTLFLDRDGVINKRIVDDYVLRTDQFIFNSGAVEAIASFNPYFGKILVVTNQQGVGKGLMTEVDLLLIHQYMIDEVEKKGGRIDKIYFCPALKEAYSINRKPQIGMALQARKEYPQIRFNKSVMVGDSLSDMQFGKNAGMVTVLIKENPNMAKEYPSLVDYYFTTLFEFSQALLKSV